MSVEQLGGYPVDRQGSCGLALAPEVLDPKFLALAPRVLDPPLLALAPEALDPLRPGAGAEGRLWVEQYGGGWDPGGP